MRPYQVQLLSIRVDLGVMIMKWCSKFLRYPELEPHHQMLISVMPRVPVFFREALTPLHWVLSAYLDFKKAFRSNHGKCSYHRKADIFFSIFSCAHICGIVPGTVPCRTAVIQGKITWWSKETRRHLRIKRNRITSLVLDFYILSIHLTRSIADRLHYIIARYYTLYYIILL